MATLGSSYAMVVCLLQSVVHMVPIILWNVMTKAKLLAVLRGTEEFLEDLLKLVNNETKTAEVILLNARAIQQTRS